ncbi:MAG TPA: DUF885 domain-containing protein [Candidatus Polarisedimenticolia bacterium]|nr:DUF885 domain-containing protein [Candidatus Polarisedimenticolia bacterium]
MRWIVPAVWLAAAFWGPVLAAGEAPQAPITPAGLREIAHDYYKWRYEQYPVAASDAGAHGGDHLLADYSPSAREARRQRVEELLAMFAAADTSLWSVDDRVDLALLKSDLNRDLFEDRVLRRAKRDAGLYVDECTNAIFSLLKKEYAPRRIRARAATARLTAMPALLTQARTNLDEPVALLARLAYQAIDAAGALFNDSLGLLMEDLPEKDRAGLVAARESALAALREFGAWLRATEPKMRAPLAMGRDNYNTLLRDVYLMPMDSEQITTIGRVELARAKALEAWLPDPTLADTLGRPTAGVPASSQEFLARYEARTSALMEHLTSREILTLPSYIGPFRIQELPAAFRPTSPGGFMNPPGVFDTDPAGFYFLPAFDPRSENFYMRAAISNPLPILGHEGIPGHFLQISIANHNPSEIRRLHQDGVFQEGWALYGEEMLMRTGLYDEGPDGEAGRAQVLRLMRYRAARIAVDVKLATGEWSFAQAIDYFMREGGLDRESATGEAAGAAATPGQKMNYTVGKYQIQRLLGLCRDRKGTEFRLREFHDQLLSYGSLPLCIVEWLMLGDETTFKSVRAR